MIVEIETGIFTGAYVDLPAEKEGLGYQHVVDVRNLVDKAGNDTDDIVRFAEAARETFLRDGKVIIACDMGISRSRVVAITLLSLLGRSIDDSIDLVRDRCGNPPINLDLLQQLRAHFADGQRSSTDRLASEGSTSRLVVGAKGFVGSSLCQFFESRGDDVLQMHRGSQDLDDLVGLIRAFEASPAQEVIYAVNSKSFHSHIAFSESLRALKSVLEACRHTGKGLVYLSSMVVFLGNARFSGQRDFFAAEDLPARPYGNYAESKFFSEELIKLYARNYGVPHLIVRPSGLYGPGMRRQWIINRFIDMAARGEEITTHEYRNGNPAFEFLHIKDFLSGLEMALEDSKAGLGDRTVNLGTGKLTSTHELARQIVQVVGSRSTLAVKPIDDHVFNVCTAPGYMQSAGWRYTVDLMTGLECLAQDFSRSRR